MFGVKSCTVLKFRRILGIICTVLLLLISSACTAISVTPDDRLQQSFEANRNDFERLVTVVRVDGPSALNSAGGTLTSPEIKRLDRKLGLTCGIIRRHDYPNAVFLCEECHGSAISRDCKGYVYDEDDPLQSEASLDELAPGVHFKRLSGKWYLFRDGG